MVDQNPRQPTTQQVFFDPAEMTIFCVHGEFRVAGGTCAHDPDSCPQGAAWNKGYDFDPHDIQKGTGNPKGIELLSGDRSDFVLLSVEDRGMLLCSAAIES